jgi:hypothetical protein
MEADLEHLSVEFHDRARCLFVSEFREFNATVELLDRRKDEQVFLQQREKYTTDLQQQLQKIAKEILSRNQSHRNIGQLSQNLHSFISDYLHRFARKIEAL